MSVKDVDLNSREWCDLVFEDRNKEYGAYYLRKTSTGRHLFALSIVIGGIVILILLLKIIHFNRTQPFRDYETKPIELSDLIWLDENHDPLNKPEEKPVKAPDIFTAPLIAKDESTMDNQKEVQETNLTQDSILTSSALEEDSLAVDAKPFDQEEENDTTTIRNAQFQDGKTALLRYIYQNIHYPPAALKQRINGRVICSFIINEDGSISDVTLVKGIYIFLDEEVLRVIRSMPEWKPAVKNGKAIKIKYFMPVVFKLN